MLLDRARALDKLYRLATQTACRRARQPTTTRVPRPSERYPTRRPSLRGVEACYRGDSVRVFRLDAAAVTNRLRAAARRLLDERSEVLEVWLFGSLARRQAVPGSDADLMVIVRDEAPPFMERLVPIARYFGDAGTGCDVLVYTASEVADLMTRRSSLVQTVLAEGMCLAARAEAPLARERAAREGSPAVPTAEPGEPPPPGVGIFSASSADRDPPGGPQCCPADSCRRSSASSVSSDTSSHST